MNDDTFTEDENLMRIFGLLIGLMIGCGTLASVAAPPPSWILRSDENTKVLLDVMARLEPEEAASLGITGLDDRISDFAPGSEQRWRAAVTAAAETLQQRLAGETDADVKQDLRILIGSIERDLRGEALHEKLLLPYRNVTHTIFRGMRSLLDDQMEPERRPAALARLRKYTGIDPGYTPMTSLAEQRVRDKLSTPTLLGPFKEEVDRDLANNSATLDGIEPLFRKYDISGFEEPLAKLRKQVAAYDEFLRREVLPKTRTDFRLPAELYAHRLEDVGVDIPVDQLVRRAQVTFREVQNEMQTLAPLVARERSWEVRSYRDVLKELKKKQVSTQEMKGHFEARIAAIEEIIRRERIVSLPERPIRFRVASLAESIIQPAPHFISPRFIGNTGQQGEFVLPLKIPGTKAGQTLTMDDFTYDAFTWTLTAHEGRPGHDLQFAAILEKGVSKARAIYAFNSVNVEGWALYAEAETKPYLPLDGQFAALQARLQRAARAILDPGLQAGTIGRDEAMRVLREDVGLSEGTALQEVQRYTFKAPGQATAYFCGYTHLMELRAETERLLGPRFDRTKYHDFLLAQGLLPPVLLRQAVLESFVPSQKGN